MPTNIDGFVVFGAIEQKWLALGGSHSPLGNPVSNEFPTFDGIGRRQNFRSGMVSWHPMIGAFAVWGLIGERWLQIGTEQFGRPVTDETGTPDNRGRFNHFRALRADSSVIGDSSIYWLPETGAHKVYGAIRDFWAVNGWERSQVGYPVEPEHDRTDGPGREQRFQRGRIVWSPELGASFGVPTIHLRDNLTSIQISGTGFTPNNTVKVFYNYHDPFVFHSSGVDPRISNTDNNGFFEGASFDLVGTPPFSFINVEVQDSVTGQKANAVVRSN